MFSKLMRVNRKSGGDLEERGADFNNIFKGDGVAGGDNDNVQAVALHIHFGQHFLRDLRHGIGTDRQGLSSVKMPSFAVSPYSSEEPINNILVFNPCNRTASSMLNTMDMLFSKQAFGSFQL